MIKPEKLPNALYALQGVLVRARAIAYEGTPVRELADILDTVEMLPRFIASEKDETDTFRQYLEQIAEKHKCAFVLQRFDEPAPPQW
jgi:hypothetical protein